MINPETALYVLVIDRKFGLRGSYYIHGMTSVFTVCVTDAGRF